MEQFPTDNHYITMSKKPNFQDLPFLSKLLTLRSALLEEHNGKEIIEFADELIEERDPFEELKERGALAYLGKFSNTPELLVNPTHRNHVAFQQLVEELDELSRSWELTAARLERFSSRYEKMFSEDSEFEPKDLRNLRVEVDRFVRDFVPLLGDYEKIVSPNDLETSNSLRPALFNSTSGINFK